MLPPLRYGPDEGKGEFIPELFGSEVDDVLTKSRHPMAIPRVLGVGRVLRNMEADALDFSVEAMRSREAYKLVRRKLAQPGTSVFSDVLPSWSGS